MRRPACSHWKETPGRTEVVGRSFRAPPLAADVEAGAEIHGHLLAGGTVTDAELPLHTGHGRWLLLEVRGSVAGGLIQLEVRDATGREQARLAKRSNPCSRFRPRMPISAIDFITFITSNLTSSIMVA